MRSTTLFNVSLAVVALSCVVFPNSLKITAAASLLICFAIALASRAYRFSFDKLLFCWATIAGVSAAYCAVGLVAGAPAEAALQVIVVYIIFPLIWIVVIQFSFLNLSLSRIIGYMTPLAVVSCLTVVLYYYLFLNFGRESVEFFVEAPNVDTGREGYIGATMHVFGSLIFLFGGYVAAFDFKNAKLPQYLNLALFASIALIAGRSALILTLVIGFFINIGAAIARPGPVQVKTMFKFAFWMMPVVLILAVTMISLDLHLWVLLEPLVEKITTAGGEGRKQQLAAFITGIADHGGLGAGHGIGVWYTVSDTHPWRYEMIWVASVFRTGIIGAAIYALPFVGTIIVGATRLLRGDLDRSELYLFGAFVCSFIATNTNPYIEAFVFQWMYALPIVYFLSIHPSACRRLASGNFRRHVEFNTRESRP